MCSSHTSGDRPLSPGDGEEQGDDVIEGQPPRKKVTTQICLTSQVRCTERHSISDIGITIKTHNYIYYYLVMQRVPVPEEKKDNKYWERRRKNNEAAKKSRNLRRKKMDDELRIAKEAIQENQKLKQEIDVS